MRSVSVIGIGETKFGKLKEYTLQDLIREAGQKAIADAGIEKERIQALYIGNYNGGSLCSQSTIGAFAAEAIGLPGIPSMRTEGACASGSLSFRQACMMIAAGVYDVVLVGGAEKMTHQSTPYVTSVIAQAEDKNLEVAAGVTFPSIFGMIANRYFHEYGNVRKEMAMCAVNNHRNAYYNPDAQLHKLITVEDVYNGAPVTSPFTMYDCSLVSDGAAFVVLAATDVAKEIGVKNRIVEVIGSGHGGDTMTLVSKPCITTLAATLQARDEAFKMAGVTNADIDLVELHDCFTITQIINIEDLGFFEKGKGAKAVAEGKIAYDGAIPVNMGGGLKAKGHPIGATGISQIYEIVNQIRGNAGDRQLNRAEIGLTHNLGGAAGTCTIHIFRGL